MKQRYLEVNFRADSLTLIDIINGIVRDYMSQGYTLTVRQLYYQLVAKAIIPNTEKSYKRITGLVNDARMAGLVDWEAIEDRTREFISRPNWATGSSILRSAANSFHMDMWDNQRYRVFCIVEKEALAGVLERACHSLDVPLLAARGYPSSTVLREFAKDSLTTDFGQINIILHLGDHDPSGIDMSRDLEERLRLFSTQDPYELEFQRIALNMDQIEQERPPPNPAKSTDSRFMDYRKKFGDKSWELDALSPSYLNALILQHVDRYRDLELWEEKESEIKNIKERILAVAGDFDDHES